MNNKLTLEELIEKNKKELFSEVADYLENPDITDVEWDGNLLWITELGKGCYSVDQRLSKQFIDNLSIRLGNTMKTHFNVSNPVLEAHTEDLRISIFHESRSGEKSIVIRKIPIFLRYNHDRLVQDGTMPEELLNLLENCVKANCNIVIGGRPRAGKTELLKYCSKFIPANKKVITLEDNAEIHYRQLFPTRKHTPFIVDDNFTYSDAIKACVRHNADWLLLSESRGPEVIELLNAVSTGNFCMTTLHVDGVKDIPDRMYNMLGTTGESVRFINNIYRYIDVGLVIKADNKENRIVSELGFFSRVNGENKYTPFYNSFEGLKPKEELPVNIKRAFSKVGIDDPYKRPETPTDVEN